MSSAYDENKARRDEEINRIVDIAVAEENRKLQEGGPGPGDPVADRCVPFTPDEVGRGPCVADDDYREIIEAEPIDAPKQERGRLPSHLRFQVDAIREKARTGLGYSESVRIEVGVLLEIIDAFDQGRL